MAFRTGVGISDSNPQPVQAGAPSSFTAAIDSGTSLSSAIDLDDQRVHRIVVPAGWTAAAITFQASHDGVAWAELYDRDGAVAIAAADAVAGRAIVVDQAVFYGVRWLKLRSGTAGAPVNQVAARAVLLVTAGR